ncbi:MAG: FAD-dependent oxidoreductase [Abitibacteriaceae bacterium]|nr:FAD-dependent oxidoreductase [Abditibacteriaceae bacterium]
MIPNLYYYNPNAIKPMTQTLQADICIYGGTSAGVAAAVQASRMGKQAVVLEPSGHIGGLSAGGLGCTDFGNKDVIGGISREFYRRVGQKYGVAEEWHFEPHVAEQVFHDLMDEAKVPVYYHQFLQAVEKNGLRITAIKLQGGLTVRAKMFVDASYEGDLMAKAGVTYDVGRESNATYGETLNGVQIRKLHQFDFPVDPYIKEGDPTSGLLPGINADAPPEQGTGDKRIQAYNFRLCLTKELENRIPFPKPENYDPQQYVLLARYLATGWNEVFRKFDPIRGHKVDKNNHGAISTDFIGMNYQWPEGDYATRERIFQQHVAYTQGLMWFMGNDPSVPQAIRDEWNQWGLCKDEFTETGGWSHQLYIREARRMKSDYVMTEHNCRGEAQVEDAVGLGSYNMDSHNCQRFVKDGRVWNEGDVQIGVKPYGISYRAIVPKRGECENLIIPVCLSSSHIAYGSIRMEPVFMVLGQSAATAAALALDRAVSVQELRYDELKKRLEQDQQVLAWAN